MRFVVRISDKDNLFQVRTGGSKVMPRPGHITHIDVTPLQLVSDDDARTLSIEQRNCRFRVMHLLYDPANI